MKQIKIIMGELKVTGHGGARPGAGRPKGALHVPWSKQTIDMVAEQLVRLQDTDHNFADWCYDNYDAFYKFVLMKGLVASEERGTEARPIHIVLENAGGPVTTGSAKAELEKLEDF